MSEEKEELVSRTYRVTEENRAEALALVKEWPELLALVRQLQADQLFPGLRGLQITLTGEKKEVAKGLGAALVKNAPEGVLGGGDAN